MRSKRLNRARTLERIPVFKPFLRQSFELSLPLPCDLIEPANVIRNLRRGCRDGFDSHLHLTVYFGGPNGYVQSQNSVNANTRVKDNSGHGKAPLPLLYPPYQRAINLYLLLSTSPRDVVQPYQDSQFFD